MPIDWNVNHSVNNKNKNEKYLIMGFYLMLLLKDLAGIAIPSMLLSLIWIAIIISTDDSTGAAFTVASTICFASSVSVMIPVTFFLVWKVIRGRYLQTSLFLLLTAVALFIEAGKFLKFDDQMVGSFLYTAVVYLLVAVIITNQFHDEYEPGIFLGNYVMSFFILSMDSLLLTVRNEGSLASLLNNSVRIGMTNFNDDIVTQTLSVNANGIGLLSMVAILCVTLLIEYQWMQKKWGLPLIVYFVIIGLMTMSKTFFLAFFLSLAVYVVLKFRSLKGHLKRKILFLIFLIVGMVVLKETTVFSNVMERFLHISSLDDLLTGRLEIDQQYLEVMGSGKNFLFGYGLQNILEKMDMTHSPHNAMVEIFACLGAVGVVLYVAFFAAVLIYAKRFSWSITGDSIPAVNYVPFAIYLFYIQALQFVRVLYIYTLLVPVVMMLCLRRCPETECGEEYEGYAEYAEYEEYLDESLVAEEAVNERLAGKRSLERVRCGVYRRRPECSCGGRRKLRRLERVGN